MRAKRARARAAKRLRAATWRLARAKALAAVRRRRSTRRRRSIKKVRGYRPHKHRLRCIQKLALEKVRRNARRAKQLQRGRQTRAKRARQRVMKARKKARKKKERVSKARKKQRERARKAKKAVQLAKLEAGKRGTNERIDKAKKAQKKARNAKEKIRKAKKKARSAKKRVRQAKKDRARKKRQKERHTEARELRKTADRSDRQARQNRRKADKHRRKARERLKKFNRRQRRIRQSASKAGPRLIKQIAQAGLRVVSEHRQRTAKLQELVVKHTEKTKQEKKDAATRGGNRRRSQAVPIGFVSENVSAACNIALNTQGTWTYRLVELIEKGLSESQLSMPAATDMTTDRRWDSEVAQSRAFPYGKKPTLGKGDYLHSFKRQNCCLRSCQMNPTERTRYVKNLETAWVKHDNTTGSARKWAFAALRDTFGTGTGGELKRSCVPGKTAVPCQKPFGAPVTCDNAALDKVDGSPMGQDWDDYQGCLYPPGFDPLAAKHRGVHMLRVAPCFAEKTPTCVMVKITKTDASVVGFSSISQPRSVRTPYMGPLWLPNSWTKTKCRIKKNKELAHTNPKHLCNALLNPKTHHITSDGRKVPGDKNHGFMSDDRLLKEPCRSDDTRSDFKSVPCTAEEWLQVERKMYKGIHVGERAGYHISVDRGSTGLNKAREKIVAGLDDIVRAAVAKLRFEIVKSLQPPKIVLVPGFQAKVKFAVSPYYNIGGGNAKVKTLLGETDSAASQKVQQVSLKLGKAAFRTSSFWNFNNHAGKEETETD